MTGAGIPTLTARLRPDVGWHTMWRAAGFGITGRPPELALYRSPEMVVILRRLLRSQPHDIIQVEETILTHYLDVLPLPPSSKKVLTYHNVHFVQGARAAALEQNTGMRFWRRFNSLFMRYYEPRIAGRFDRRVTVTDHDRKLLLRASPGLAFDVVPNGVDTRSLAPMPFSDGPAALVFVGSMAYKPCEDAAVWLVRKILPLVRQQLGEVQVWIVGRDPGRRVKELAGDGVFVTGEVADVIPFYARATVAVAPLRAGSGSRLKILEAMALGRPLVSTSIGAEGLEVKNGTHLLVADEPADFAAAIVKLICDEDLRNALAVAARGLVELRHGWDDRAEELLQIYDEMAVRP